MGIGFDLNRIIAKREADTDGSGVFPGPGVFSGEGWKRKGEGKKSGERDACKRPKAPGLFLQHGPGPGAVRSYPLIHSSIPEAKPAAVPSGPGAGSADEMFGNLNGVEGRAFSQVVGHHP